MDPLIPMIIILGLALSLSVFSYYVAKRIEREVLLLKEDIKKLSMEEAIMRTDFLVATEELASKGYVKIKEG